MTTKAVHASAKRNGARDVGRLGNFEDECLTLIKVSFTIGRKLYRQPDVDPMVTRSRRVRCDVTPFSPSFTKLVCEDDGNGVQDNGSVSNTATAIVQGLRTWFRNEIITEEEPMGSCQSGCLWVQIVPYNVVPSETRLSIGIT